MELSLIRSLMDKEFYTEHRGARCPDRLFSADARKIKQAIDTAMDRYERTVTPDEIEALFMSNNPTMTTAQKQGGSLQEKLMAANSRMAEIRAHLEEQQVTNRDIMEANTRLENETKTSKFRYETVKKELDAFKTAMHDIHSEASRSSGRVRQRYFKLNKDKK